MKKNNDDTIAAISTPVGTGGIGIVRVSGPEAVNIAAGIFRGPDLRYLPSHTAQYGHVMSGDRIADEAIVTVYRAPRTYTREDLVELGCHGGTESLKKVLDACLSAGARLARPGEFTKRAFLNGRIDLSQAEAVLDIINSETRAAHKAAMAQLEGTLSRALRELRHEVVNALSLIELTIDFSQQDVEFPRLNTLKPKINKAIADVKGLLETAGKGMILRQGASVVICGRPNVGKSSLMNALLRHERVIVTPIAGTTRDVIEEHIEIAGVKVRITDTAGIIDTTDRVELEGIKRSREKLARADMVLFVVDASSEITGRDREIFEAVSDKESIVVLNKTDLDMVTGPGETGEAFPGRPLAQVSALKNSGLDLLEDLIAERLFGAGTIVPEEGTLITNARHKEALENALVSLERAAGTDNIAASAELIASDLKDAVQCIGQITGHTVQEDVLDRIFGNFCIGK